MVKNTNRNKPVIIKLIDKGKYQSIPKKFVTKKYENIVENISEDITIGINNINDSKIINLRVFNLPKPSILNTKFW